MKAFLHWLLRDGSLGDSEGFWDFDQPDLDPALVERVRREQTMRHA
ncbi:hypothetical protein [Deinococcus yavapaiensis]|nr:hypothetical protein [Deinococcus yavapaiensis]